MTSARRAAVQPAEDLYGGYGDPSSTQPHLLYPAEEQPARPPRGRRRRKPRRRWPVPRWVVLTGLAGGSALTAVSHLPLSGAVAWLVAWALIVFTVTGLLESGRRWWVPRAVGAWQDRGTGGQLEEAARFPAYAEAVTRGRRADPVAGEPEDDGGEGWSPAPRRTAGPGGRRAAARTRAALAARQFTATKTTVEMSAEARAWADRIKEFSTEDGDELEAWLDQVAADFYGIAEAVSDAHDTLVNDTDLDEIPCAAVHDVADEVAEVGASVLGAKEKILTYYEDPRAFADAGGKMPKDKGDFWEQH